MRHHTMRNTMRLGAVLLLATACQDSATGPERAVPAEVRVSASEVSLESLGDSIALAAQVFDVNGRLLPDIPVIWRVVEGDAISMVDDRGRVTSVANGTARLVAEVPASYVGVRPGRGYHAGEVSAPVQFTVQQVARSVTLRSPSLTLWAIGASTTLTPVAADARGSAMDGLPTVPSWESSSSSVLTVDPAGRLRAVGDGQAQVTVRSGDLTSSLTMTVSASVPLAGCVAFAGAPAQDCAPLVLTVTERVP